MAIELNSLSVLATRLEMTINDIFEKIRKNDESMRIKRKEKESR